MKVWNRLNKVLDAPTKALLEKGLNFAITTRSIPIKEIICGTKPSIQELPLVEAEEIRGEAYRVLITALPAKCNISKKEREALAHL